MVAKDVENLTVEFVLFFIILQGAKVCREIVANIDTITQNHAK